MTKSLARRWMELLAGFGIIALFMFVIGPALRAQSESIDTFASYVDRTGVDTGAIWWSELEEVADAELGARSTVTYQPTGPGATE